MTELEIAADAGDRLSRALRVEEELVQEVPIAIQRDARQTHARTGNRMPAPAAGQVQHGAPPRGAPQFAAVRQEVGGRRAELRRRHGVVR